MKSIELTEEQKEKLLKMCKVLFPEISNGGGFYLENHLCKPGEYENSIDELSEAKTNFVSFYNFSNHKNDEKKLSSKEYFEKYFNSIHWFEFCMTILATNLYNQNNRDEISSIELYRGNIIQNYHPIDYLYEEFKKLK